MLSPDVTQPVQDLLDGLSDLEVRELCLASLREVRVREPNESTFSLHGMFGRVLLHKLAQRRGVQMPNDQIGKEVFLECIGEPWMTGVAEFVFWLVNIGAVCALTSNKQYPFNFRITRAGVRLLARGADHPLLPGYVERLKSRCPGLPDGVLALLVDSTACTDHALNRGSITLLGVAYELAVEGVLERLVAQGRVNANVLEKKAAVRIAAARAVIDAVVADRERRFAILAAYDFADSLRRRRNDASHTTPTFGFEDREECEELQVSAGRHLPNLWALGL